MKSLQFKNKPEMEKWFLF